MAGRSLQDRVRHLERLAAADGVEGRLSSYTDLTPIAAMVQDEFLLWVKQDAPYQNVQDYLKAVAAKTGGDFKMGGAQSKDTDETLTRMIDKAAKVEVHLHSVQERRRGRGAAGRRPCRHPRQQSQRKHRPVEGQHPAAALRLQPAAAAGRPEGDGNAELARHPDLRRIRPRHPAIPAAAHGLAAAARSRAEQAAFYVDLMKKVQATPEWKEYIERTSQTDTFLTGDAFSKFIKRGHRARPQGRGRRGLAGLQLAASVDGLADAAWKRRRRSSPARSASRSSSPASTTASAGRPPASRPAPFRSSIGLIILAGSLYNLVQGWLRGTRRSSLRADELKRLAALFVPGRASLSRVIPLIGMYVASAVYVFGALRLAQSAARCRSRRCIARRHGASALYLVFELHVPGHRCRAACSALRSASEGTRWKISKPCCTASRIALSGNHIVLMLIGVLLGILVGVLPGLGAPNGVSLLLPLTFGMQPVSAIILLS